MQTAAHNLSFAASSAVPNGLQVGGLVPDGGLAAPGVAKQVLTWHNATTPVQSAVGGQTVITVRQTAKNAILNWSSFNIGTRTTLSIDQSGGNIATGNNYVALNRVTDPAKRPSEILGSIKAQGTVLIINQNGIIFGGGAQVDVHSLIASSLYLLAPVAQTSDNLFLAGLDAGLTSASNEQLLGTPNGVPSDVAAGNITIERGAAINVTGRQGYVLIAAPNVANGGSINAPDGQVVLAATPGLQISAPFTPDKTGSPATPIQNPVLTGSIYPVPAAGNAYPLTALVNTGLLQADRGNITLLGGDITQNGVVIATTSVQHAGTIVLNAEYAGSTVGGSVTFGRNATTSIRPDADGQTIPISAAATFMPGSITIAGGGIDFQGGSLLDAPGQSLSISTTEAVGVASVTGPGSVPTNELTANALGASGNTVLEPGSVVDVSGIANIELPMSANLITVPRLGQNELADDPLARNGFLYDQKNLVFDIRDTGVNPLTGLPWVGSPLADLQGYVSQIPETVDQLLVNAGSITVYKNFLGAPTSFVAEPGSVINITAGYVHYLGGILDTTELLGADGHIYNVGSANINIPIVGYAGQFTAGHPQWGVSEAFKGVLFSAGAYAPDYIQGGNGGTLKIGYMPASAADGIGSPINSFLGGVIDAATFSGTYQASAGNAPTGSSLMLAGYNNVLIAAGQPTLPSDFRVDTPFTKPLVAPPPSDYGSGFAAFQSNLQIDITVLSARSLNDAGFSNLDFGKTVAAPAAPLGQDVNNPVQDVTQVATTYGSFTLAAGASLAVQPGGSVLIGAPGDITIDGSILAPAGTISVESYGSLSQHFYRIGNLNDINIGAKAVLNVAGEWLNDRTGAFAGQPEAGGQIINAGTITLASDRDSYHLYDPSGNPVYGVPLGTHFVPPAAPYTPDFTNPVTIDQTGSINVAAGARLDLQSGGRVLPSGIIQTTSSGAPAGTGGNLNLLTYTGAGWGTEYDNPQGPSGETGALLPFEAPTAAHIHLDGTVNATGFASGGTLTVQAPSIQIGGSPSNAPGQYYVPANFFTDNRFDQSSFAAGAGGAFGNYDFIGVLGGVAVAPGTTIKLRQRNFQIGAALNLPTGGDIATAATLGVSPAIYRAPVNLTLNANETYTFTPEGASIKQYYSPNPLYTDPAYSGPTGTYVTASDALYGLPAPIKFAPGEDPSLYLGASSPVSGLGLYATPPPVIGAPVTIVADPKAAIALLANSDILINGNILAPGGAILVTNGITGADGQMQPGNVYVLPYARLSVAGAFIPNTLNLPNGVVPPAGLVTLREGSHIIPAHTGTVLDGGSISFIAGAVIAQAGSVLDVSGTEAVRDQAVYHPEGLSVSSYAPIAVYSNAGSIDFSVATAGQISPGAGTLLLDGTLLGQPGRLIDGGEGMGGTLTINNSYQATSQNGAIGQPIIISATAAALPTLRKLKIALNGALTTNKPLATIAGAAYLPVSELQSTGIDSLNLQGFVAFSGPVDLALGRQLSIYTSNPGYALNFSEQGPDIALVPLGANAATFAKTLAFSAGKTPLYTSLARNLQGRSVTVSAPYISFIGGVGNPAPVSRANGMLTFDAAAIDISGQTVFANIASLNINSAGTIRLSGVPPQPLDITNGLVPGLLVSNGDLNLDAGMIYPESGETFGIFAYGAHATIGIYGNGNVQAPPVSAGSTLFIAAATIVQDGNIQVPFGRLQLGSLNPATDLAVFAPTNTGVSPAPAATTSLTIGAGSVTSVSGAGIAVPYGETVDNTDAYYLNHAGLPLSAPPQKLLYLDARSISVDAGADVNFSGGGTIYETEFVPGTGGSRNVLSRYEFNPATASSAGGLTNPYNGTPLYDQYPNGEDVYAIVPGSQPQIAYNDPDLGTFYFDGQTKMAGQAIYLSGVPGLGAGTYTLLPGIYATLPGAYRVVVDPGAVLEPGTPSVTLPDGTVVANGYYANSVVGQRSATPTVFSIEPRATWSSYSQINITNASAFFPGVAALAQQPVPRLPQDAGHVILQVLQGLNIESRLNGAAVDGGRVAEADVTGVNIEIISTGGTVQKGFVGLAANSLDALNAGSLLIGATRGLNDVTTTIDNVNFDTSVITPTAQNIIVANNAANPLTAPEIMFAVTPAEGKRPVNITTPNSEAASKKAPSPASGVIKVNEYGASNIIIEPGAVVRATGAVTGAQPQILQIGDMAIVDPTSGVAIPLSKIFTPDAKFGGYDLNNGVFVNSNISAVQQLYNAVSESSGALVHVSNGIQPQIIRPDALIPASYGPSINDTTEAYGQNVSGSFHISGYEKFYLPKLPLSTVSIAAGAVLSSQGSLALSTTGPGNIADNASIASPDVAITARQVTLGNADAGTGVLVLDNVRLGSLSKAGVLSIASYNPIQVVGSFILGGAGTALRSLMLDGPLLGDGGAVVLDAASVTLQDTLSNAAPVVSFKSQGSFNVNAATLVLGAGSNAVYGYGAVTMGASSQLQGTGTGNLDVGNTALTFNTPLLLAETGSSQTINTSGEFKLLDNFGAPAMLSTDQSGGAWTVSAASITSDSTIEALSGIINLIARNGNLAISGGALRAGGFSKQFFDAYQYAPGGTINLSAVAGDITGSTNSVLDVSGATLGGNAGTINVQAASGEARIGSVLLGRSVAGGAGASLTLDTAQALALDPLAALLQAGGFTKQLSLRTRQGDLSLTGALTASSVLLVADGGMVAVSGVIDASGVGGGIISLYGQTGVTLASTARLLARASDPTRLGGDITLGTEAINTNGVNASDGSEAVTRSGAIEIASGAVIDVSGGVAQDGSSLGGVVALLAPVLAGNNVNVSSAGAVLGARSAALDAFKTWATGDSSVGGQHFDGIIDPAGYFAANGQRVNGTWYYYAPNKTGGYKRGAGYGSNQGTAYQDGPYETKKTGTEVHGVRYDIKGKVVADGAPGFFVPNAPNSDHVAFYQGTVMNFVQNPGVKAPAGFTLEPGVDLVSDQRGVNGGNITVASNWNFGAGGIDARGGLTLFYRVGGTANGAPGVLTLRALNNVNVNADLTDGFFQTRNSASPAYTLALDAYALNINNLNSTTGPVTDGNGAQPSGSLLGTLAAPVTPYDSNDPLYVSASKTYEAAYLSYVKDWRAFTTIAGQVIAIANEGLPHGTYNYGLLTAASGPVQPSDYPSYAAYITAYDAYVSSYMPNDQNGKVSTVSAPAGPLPTQFASFTDYSVAYSAYNIAFGQYFVAYGKLYLRAAKADLPRMPVTQAAFPVAPNVEVAPVPASSGTFNIANVMNNPSYYGANGPANNPTLNDPNPVASADLFAYDGSGPGSFVSSWSYQITSGANLASADPAQVQPLTAFTAGAALQGDVNLNAHTEYPWIYSGPGVAYVQDDPTTIRTGTGYIDIAAAQDVATLDPIAPAVIYTAGHASTPPLNAETVVRPQPGVSEVYDPTAGYASSAASTNPALDPLNIDGFSQATGPYFNYNTTLQPGNSLPNNATLGQSPDNVGYSGAGTPILFAVPAYPEDGGNLTITAQRDIVGIQNVLDVNQNRNTSALPTFIGQFWNSWLFITGTPATNDNYGWYSSLTADNQNLGGSSNGSQTYTQPAWWINFASFDQGVGALGGGNVRITAGRNVQELAVALPTTGQVWGGLTYDNADGSRNLPITHFYGAGDLTEQVGGDLISGAIYVGNGDARISVGGAVQADASAIPLEFAVQNSRIILVANGDVDVGGVISPTELLAPGHPGVGVILDPVLATTGDFAQLVTYGSPNYTGGPEATNVFSTYSPTSSLSVVSTGGMVNYDVGPAYSEYVSGTAGLGGYASPLFLAGGGNTYTNETVSVTSLVADTPANLLISSFLHDVTLVNQFTLTPSETGTLGIYAGGNINQDATYSSGASTASIAFDPTQLLLGYNAPTEGMTLLHVNDVVPNQIYADANVQDLVQNYSLNDMYFNKLTEVAAGHDLVNLNFFGENLTNTDVTSVTAGHDIKRTLYSYNGIAAALGNSYSIEGPGFFYIAAGRNLGPFVPSNQIGGGPVQTGIIATGDYTAPGASTINPLLPAKSAEIFAYAGVLPGIDYSNLTAAYLDPATARLTDNGVGLGTVLQQLSLATGALTPTAAFDLFKSFKPLLQDVVAGRYFFDVLEASGKTNASTPDNQRNYLSGYQIIDALFPATYGYTENNLTGTGTAGAIHSVSTGNFDLRNSLVETQQTSDISLFAPGGEILVGSAGVTAAQLSPADAGIITIQSGSIFTFSDQSIEVNQSRIFAESGGDIVMWSSNGDIDAGRGTKTTSSFPPPSYICDVNNVCYIDARGAVSGAGIATLQSVAGASTGNAVLVAPAGTVNAGDAGIRVSGNLYISALHVLNADNIQVQGTTTGVPTAPSVNVSALTSATNASGAAVQAAENAGRQRRQNQSPSIWLVEVLGYGGDEDINEPHKKKKLLQPR